MALFGTLGPALTAGLGAIGNIFGGTLGSLGNVGSAITGALVPAVGPAAPTVLAAASIIQPQAPVQVAMASRAIFPVAGGAIQRMVGGVLIKIAQTLGVRTMSVRRAIKIVRRMAVVLPPAAVAAALGLTIAELAELITAAANMPTRRMNPANIKALRRSMRRIQSFHRLCQKADTLRGRGSRRRGAKVCPPGGATIVQAR